VQNGNATAADTEHEFATTIVWMLSPNSARHDKTRLTSTFITRTQQPPITEQHCASAALTRWRHWRH